MSDTQYWQERLPDIVFVGGKKRSGKDYVCDLLVSEAGFTKVHIVEPWLRWWCSQNGYNPNDWETVKFKEREHIQRDAAEARAKKPTVLIDWMRQSLPTLPKPVCVTAVRFINEMQLGMQVGALCVRVKTSDTTRQQRFEAAGDTSPMDDPFEKEVDLMPVHLELSGEMDAAMYVPTLAKVYQDLSTLVFREAIRGVQAAGGK